MMTNYFLNVFLLLKGDRGLSGDKGEKVSVLLGNVKVYDLHHCAHTRCLLSFHSTPDFLYRAIASRITLVLKVIPAHLDKE